MHDHPSFKGLTCFEILHSQVGQQVFQTSNSGRYDYTINKAHPVICDVRLKHGLQEVGRGRRKRARNEDEDEDSQVEDNEEVENEDTTNEQHNENDRNEGGQVVEM